MTSLPATTEKKLGLVIDLDTCVGCQACVTSCKEWNTGGHMAPLTDTSPMPAAPTASGSTASILLSSRRTARADRALPPLLPALRGAACVTVCPTGASYKRTSDGIVLVDEDKCIGCKLCSWACPYGAREFDTEVGVMKKCTLCIDRIYNQNLPEDDRIPACVAACPTGARHFGDLGDPASPVSRLAEERGGVDLMPQMGYRPTNKYLPPRERKHTFGETAALAPVAAEGGFLGWVDRMLSR